MDQDDFFPWQRELQFINGVAPFDTLAEAELREVVSRVEVAFFRRGVVIIEKGGPPAEHLYLINSGSAKISLPGQDGGEEVLVDVRGEGDSFGAVSLLHGHQALFQVTAREDLICYLLPGPLFVDLVARHPTFERHYSHSLARNLESLRRGAEVCQLPHMSGLETANLRAAALANTRVREVMHQEVLTCLPATSLRAAALAMTRRQVGSIVVVDETDHPLGILTDTDFRVKVMLRARTFEQPVAEFMSQPVHTLPPETLAFEAVLSMSRHGVRHLLVTDDDDRLLGMVADRDLQSLTGGSPVGVVREIEKVEDLEDLVKLHSRIDRVLEMLLRLGGSAKDLLLLVTEFNDRLTIKLLELIAAEMESDGPGRAPVPFCWMALGSEGRREQTLRTDQDNALIYANVPRELEPGIQAWFLEFGRRVAEGLERCGFPRCEGGVMAMNPQWCLSEAAWQRTFAGWVAEPNPVTLRLASIFFDFRALYAEADYVENLTVSLKEHLETNSAFLRFMAKNSLYNRPPLGFLRQFVVTKAGEHKDQLNLKLGGLTPIVDGARVMALDQAVLTTNTLDRLAEITRRGLVKETQGADLMEAFGFLTLLRIRHHLEARARGEVPDNFVDPAQLNNMQRTTLKESFRVISDFQELLEHRYQTWSLGV